MNRMITFGFKNGVSGILRAACAIAIGLIMIIVPGDSLVLVVKILASFLIASGIVSLAWGIVNRQKGVTGLMSVNAVVDIALGVIMFMNPAFVAGFIIVLLGIVLLVFGLFQTIALLSAVTVLPMGFAAFIFPVLTVFGGLVLLFRPSFIASFLTVVAGVALLVYGVSELISTWRMRRAMKAYEVKFPGEGKNDGNDDDNNGFDIAGAKDAEFEKVEK